MPLPPVRAADGNASLTPGDGGSNPPTLGRTPQLWSRQPNQRSTTISLRHDVTDEASWAEAVERTLATYGRLDMLVNNAGFATLPEPQDPETVTIAHWRAVNGVNVEGVLLGCQAGIRAMKAAGGVIVNISSIAALNPSPRMAAYGASKAAVRHLTRTVAAWCTQQGFAIRCNSIHPG